MLEMKHIPTIILLVLFVSIFLQFPARKVDLSALMTRHIPYPVSQIPNIT